MITKEEFVQKHINKLTNRYTPTIDNILNFLSISISIFFTFSIKNSHSVWLIFFLSIFAYVFIRFFLMVLFKGISFGHVSYIVYYMNTKVNFFIFLHFSTLFFSSLINYFKLEFTIDGKDISLTFFQSYYYVFSVITTVGSNIFPKSDEASFLTMLLSLVTLLFVIFVYSTLTHKETIKKSFVKSAERYLLFTYDRFNELFLEKELDNQKKEELFDYLINNFDFNTPNGYHKIYYEIKNDRYPF